MLGELFKHLLGANQIPEQQAGWQNPFEAQMQGDRQSLLSQMGQLPMMRPPDEPVQPAYRTEDAIKGGLGLLVSALAGGDKGATAFTQNFAQTKQNQADKKTQTNEQKRQEENQRMMQAYQTGLNVNNAKLGFSTQDFNRAEGAQAKSEAATQKGVYDQQKRDEASLNNVSNAYTRAKTLADMQSKAKRWRDLEIKLGLDTTAPDEQGVLDDFMQRSAGIRNQIEDNFRQTVGQALNEYGVVEGANKSSLTSLKKRYQSELESYGIKDAELFLPTEETLQKEKQDQWMEMAKQKKIDDHDKAVQQIAKSKADIARAKERIEIARTNSNTSKKNADTQRFSYELRKAVQESNKMTQTEIKKITNKIDGIEGSATGLRAKQKSMAERGDLVGAQRVGDEIKELEAKRDFWSSQIETVPKEPTQPGQGTVETKLADGTGIRW